MSAIHFFITEKAEVTKPLADSSAAPEGASTPIPSPPNLNWTHSTGQNPPALDMLSTESATLWASSSLLRSSSSPSRFHSEEVIGPAAVTELTAASAYAERNPGPPITECPSPPSSCWGFCCSGTMLPVMPVLPNPPSSRSVNDSSSTTRTDALEIRSRTSCAILIPGSTLKSLLEWLIMTTISSPR